MIFFLNHLFLAVLGLCCSGFSLVAENGAALRGSLQACCGGCSCCGAQAQQLWLMGLTADALWGPPRPGIEPVSCTLAAGFFTTEPPGKPFVIHFE